MALTFRKVLFSTVISFIFQQALAQNLCDGPYIFYNKDQVTIRSIDSDSKAVIEKFSLAEIDQHPVTIHFSNHTNWDFNVPIRKQIEIEPSEYDHVDKLFAVSDIEGQFEAFRNLLIANQVMDSLYQWTFSKNHVVICGDLFDRGKDVAPLLWLLYKLEDEAIAAGGRLHTILGNHDIMNLTGDFRYVDQKYLSNAKLMGVKYDDLYTKNTELGRWLISKNIIEKIDTNLCLHAGISSSILARKMTAEDINTTCRPYYTKCRHPEDMGNSSISVFFGSKGPFWYRGYFDKPGTSESTVNKTLAFYHCQRIVVGHTISGTAIAGYYKDKVIGIDVDVHAGYAEGIIITNDQVFTTDLTGILEPIREAAVMN